MKDILIPTAVLLGICMVLSITIASVMNPPPLDPTTMSYVAF